MKRAAVLAGAVGLLAAGCAEPCCPQPQGQLPYAQIYGRATNVFQSAAYIKPAESSLNRPGALLAPLILQESVDPGGVAGGHGCFGQLSVADGAPLLDTNHPAIYWDIDSVQVYGKAHARFSYIWFYSSAAAKQKTAPGSRAQGAKAVPSAQGVRVTLNASGQPAIWEVLADGSGADVVFVSQSLEAAAAAEFGRPPPGRRFAIEQSVQAAPQTVVARVIEDGPVAMGPIVYLNPDAGTVSTVICRCMPAQAKKLVSTTNYELLPWHDAAGCLLDADLLAALKARAAFWPGAEPARAVALEKRLRLPHAF